MCKVIAIANQKGGVAKTTSAVSLGVGIVNKGDKVLIIDCDPQGSCTVALGYQEPDRLDFTLTTIAERILNEEDYGFYLDLRKYGSTRHSGFGLGFERCVMYLTGMQNIRDVIPFPRTVNNCEL